MAKNNYNSLINTINHNISHGVNHQVLHLTTNDVSGQMLNIDSKNLVNFSSYSYLNLDSHPQLINHCIEAVKKYGTQFGYSRAFVSVDIYKKLEDSLSKIFNNTTIVAPSTTLAHQAAMPVVFGDKDLILMDQYAHASMQTSIKMLKERGVKIELVRHNRIDIVEAKFKEYHRLHSRVWYMGDGVYSMHGDYANLSAIENLLNKYKTFYYYVDDAHGMSWTGENGKGYVLSQMDLHPKMILTTSMNKAFAASGGAIVLADDDWADKIRNCGSTLIFSTPVPNPMLGAGLASAELHFTEEFKKLQIELHKKINHCRSIITQHNLPEVSQNGSPIFFIPCSLPEAAINLSKKMVNEGYYLSPTMFPAVGSKQAGIRFCINVNLSYDQITEMIALLKKHYKTALSDAGIDEATVAKNFTKLINIQANLPEKIKDSEWQIEEYDSINEIDKTLWDNIFDSKGIFDYEGLQTMEKGFSNNQLPEDNWKFHYIIIKSKDGEPILLTYFTSVIIKDDMLEPAEVSKKIEQIRKTNKYYLCSKTLMMGTIISEGTQLYINPKYDSAMALDILLSKVGELQKTTNSNMVYLRDFDLKNPYAHYFISKGFIRMKLPDYSHVYNFSGWNNTEEYLKTIPGKKRNQIRKFALRHEEKFTVEIVSKASKQELENYYQLYLNVKERSFLLNNFNLPFKFFKTMNEDKCWEFIVLKLNVNNELIPVGVIFCKRGKGFYSPIYIGLDYEFVLSHKVYKQALWQIMKRGKELNVDKIFYGFTATTEKKRFGAEAIEKETFIQINDHFNIDVISSQSFKNNPTDQP